MWLHLRGDPLGERIAETHAEATADDHRLDVEHVDDGGDPPGERLDGPLDDLNGELVAVLQGTRPDAARDARAPVLLHQLEEVCLTSLLLVQLACVELHRGASRV